MNTIKDEAKYTACISIPILFSGDAQMEAKLGQAQDIALQCGFRIPDTQMLIYSGHIHPAFESHYVTEMRRRSSDLEDIRLKAKVLVELLEQNGYQVKRIQILQELVDTALSVGTFP